MVGRSMKPSARTPFPCIPAVTDALIPSQPAARKAWLIVAAFVASILGAGSLRAQNAYTFSTLAGVGPGATNATGVAASFYSPDSVAVDTGGNIYVADSKNNLIRKITSTGVVTTLAGSANAPGNANGTGTAATFNYPAGVAVDAGGNVYVADSGSRLHPSDAGVTGYLLGVWSERTLGG